MSKKDTVKPIKACSKGGEKAFCYDSTCFCLFVLVLTFAFSTERSIFGIEQEGYL